MEINKKHTRPKMLYLHVGVVQKKYEYDYKYIIIYGTQRKVNTLKLLVHPVFVF